MAGCSTTFSDEEHLLFSDASSEEDDFTTDIEVLSESEVEDDDIGIQNNVNIDPVWVKTPPQFGVAEFDFTGNSGVNTDIVDNDEPLFLFELIFTDELIDHIVEMTNKYAAQQTADPTFKISSRLKRWKEVTANEIRLLIGFILYQGVVCKPTYAHYSTSNWFYFVPRGSM